MIKKITKIIPGPIKYFVKKIFGREFAKNSDVIPYIKKSLSCDIVSVLDVGCGRLWDGNSESEDILLSIFKDTKYKVTGIDIFQDCVDWRKEHGPKGDYRAMDVRDLDNLSGLFDVVIAHHVLEHLPKEESEKVLNMIEKKAKKQIIIGTPIGFTNTEYAVHLHNNEHERHLCAWHPSEFKDRNYKVYEIKNVLLAIKNI